MSEKMELIHLELREANNFVVEHHRHHKPIVGHRFSIGAMKNENLVGVAIVGRPVARKVDYKKVLEVTRLCTDGTKNACSFLYSATARAGKALGYEKIQTYILETEPGTSLKAAGWQFSGKTSGKHSWNNRPGRRDDQPTMPKHRYERVLKETPTQKD